MHFKTFVRLGGTALIVTGVIISIVFAINRDIKRATESVAEVNQLPERFIVANSKPEIIGDTDLKRIWAERESDKMLISAIVTPPLQVSPEDIVELSGVEYIQSEAGPFVHFIMVTKVIFHKKTH